MNTIEEIARGLKNLKSAAVFTHMRPDGDTLGSALALSRALSMLGVKTEVLNEGAIPEKFLFLADAKNIVRTPSFDAEAFILVDISDPGRLGELKEYYLRRAAKKKTFNVDHHISNKRYAQYNYVRACSSNCENIASLISALGVKPDEDIYACLFMGLVTDSGSFSHDDVTGDTLRLAARCIDGGADPAKISYETVTKRSKARAQLYAAVASNVRYFLDDKLAVALVTAEMLERYGLKADATEGIVDFARSIDVVEVSVCLLEVRHGQYQVSFRSKTADVNEIARVFGGGGHVRASGCMLFGEAEEVIDRLRFTVSQYLDL